MDVKINVTNKDQVMKIFTSKEGFHIPTIATRALNMTADQVKEALVKEMKSSFDRPTPYTLNAPYVVKKATENNMAVQVYLRGTRSVSYLTPQVHGGGRRMKAFEKALNAIGVLPDDMYMIPCKRTPRDAFGNVSSGFIVLLLSYFKGFKQGGRRSNMTDEKREKMKRGTKRKQGVEYFTLHGRNNNPGIFRRVSFSFGDALEPMFMFVKQPQYKKRLQWDEVAARVVNENWEKNLKDAGMEL
jgi:hypothetical protein